LPLVAARRMVDRMFSALKNDEGKALVSLTLPIVAEQAFIALMAIVIAGMAGRAVGLCRFFLVFCPVFWPASFITPSPLRGAFFIVRVRSGKWLKI
jgi:hypothetical protein